MSLILTGSERWTPWEGREGGREGRKEGMEGGRTYLGIDVLVFHEPAGEIGAC
jgi:hypothetical protein